ncbi:response regulator receiver protein [Actinomadura sp. DC4]|uniref:response regulator receiver protein n=1 Tax=Actinomadura sp. DC4 TaxID=3055069 RepID=UPI0025B126E5|nr:response regulator receiver protein [Actinomadura sp. DC4]MDN3352631.1 response regulator receiver protein [Actinomadura sp. DC4]
MSSGVEADIALDAAVIASLGLIRVLGGAAGLAAAGTGVLAGLAEERAEIRARRLQEIQRHEQAIAEVLDRNARIAALASSARRHHAELALPTPLEPTEQTAEELVAWCTETDTTLVAAEESLATVIASDATDRIFAAPESLQATPQDPAATPPSALATTMARVLARLLPDITDDDRRAVTEAAEQAAAATTQGEAESRLTEVRIRIQKANERARGGRDDRAAAARFLRELAAHPDAETVRARLGEIADGTRPFDADLRAEAVRLVADLQREAEHRYVTAAIQEAFEELGYEVDEGFETLTANDGEAVLTRGDWTQHAIKIRVEDARQVRMALLRTEPGESADQRRLDVEREEQWCASFEAARARLDAAGIHADVRWRVEPGEQRLPVAQPRRTRQQPRARRRERDR